LSPNTVRKHGRHLRFLFRLAGPRVRCEDSATVEGLFGRYRRRIAGRLVIGEHRLPPRIKLPKPRHKAPEDYFEIDEIERWIAAAQSAAVPQIPGVPPALWWQALIIYAYNTGLRIGTLLAVKFAWHRRDREGRLWVEIPPGIDKGGDAERVYVNRAAEEVMEMIRTERANVFPWPHCRRHLDTIRLELLARAGIPEHRRWGFHGLRKSSAGQIAETRMDVAQMQLGHAGIEMTRRHYVSQNVVAATMEQMPQPRNRRTAAIDPRQRMLFEKGSG
jgi:integrase